MTRTFLALTHLLCVALFEAQPVAARNKIKTLYIIPSDASRVQSSRSDDVMEATQEVAKRWSRWGWTMDIVDTVTTHRISQTCRSLTRWQDINQVVRDLGYSDDGNIYQAFFECIRPNTGAAYSSGWLVVYGGGVTNGITNGLRGGGAGRNVGAIGHELGHSFGLPHENCDGREEGNARELRSRGLPDKGTRSVMCNHLYPNIEKFAPYQRKLMRSEACRFFQECANPGKPVPPPSTPAPQAPPGQAPPSGLAIGDTFYVRAQHSKKCLTVSRSSSRAILQWGCRRRQEFVLRRGDAGFYRFVVKGQGCMRVIGNGESRSRLAVRECNGGVREQFRFTSENQIVSRLSEQCVDISRGSRDNGAEAITFPCHSGDNMKFTLHKN